MEEAKALCASSQVRYTALHSEVSAIQDANSEGDMRPQHKDNNPPDQTECKLLEEQSGHIVGLLMRYNDLISEGHKQWVAHEIRMIRMGTHAEPEHRHDLIPYDLIRQIGDTIEIHDTVVKDLPTLQARVLHADDCLVVYTGTIDKKVADLTTRESDQIKACKSIDLYPPQK